MKKSRTKKTVIAVVALFLLAAAYAVYSRPLTVAQRYPMLTPDKCVGMSGYYYDGEGAAFTNITIDKESEAFDALWELLYEQSYRRSLRDLLPRGGRTHRSEPGDFQWEVLFDFEDVELPNGSRGSGTMFGVQYWYGQLDLSFDGELLACGTKGQDAWAAEVLNLLR